MHAFVAHIFFFLELEESHQILLFQNVTIPSLIYVQKMYRTIIIKMIYILFLLKEQLA